MLFNEYATLLAQLRAVVRVITKEMTKIFLSMNTLGVRIWKTEQLSKTIIENPRKNQHLSKKQLTLGYTWKSYKLNIRINI